MDGEHQRVAGVAHRLVEGALEAAHLRDDQLVAEELPFGAGYDRFPFSHGIRSGRKRLNAEVGMGSL